MKIQEAKDILEENICQVKDKNLAAAMLVAEYAMTYLTTQTVTTNMLEAMMLMVLWNNRDELCASMTGCKDCPYDLGKTCDGATTEFVMRSCGKAFKAYFDNTESLIKE